MNKHLFVFAALLVALACMAGCAMPSNVSDSAGKSQLAEMSNISDVGSEGAQASEASSQQGARSEASGETADEAGRFASWNADANSLAALVSYVRAATDKANAGYVPPADRIAVFDMDGTFLSEKAPVYMDYMLLLHRVQDDSGFTPTSDMIALCEEIRAKADRGATLGAADRPYRKNDALAESFAGMTFDEFHTYVTDFLDNQHVEGFTGMTYGESFYKPMVEVIGYLQANDFEVYVVTACEREVARVAVERLGIDASHVIGSDWAYTATQQGNDDGLDYTYTQSDDLMIAGYYLGETGKTNKVIAIQREIGKQPVLAFGNSSGDFAMLNYALDNTKYPAASFLVIADDTEREYGDAETAAQMLGEVEAGGWNAISMRDDWSTIYGDSVVKTQLRADEA